MKITIDIETAGESDESLVQFTFERTGESSNMAVLRATARIMRAIGAEFSNLRSETSYIKENLSEKKGS